MGTIAFIVLGGLAGWVASMVTGTNASQGIFLNIVVGIVGAFLGGFLFNLVGAQGVTGFNIWSFVVATLGAVALLFLVRLVNPSR